MVWLGLVAPPSVLPPGVTLQAIDGETLTSSTTMSNNYYSRNNLTTAAGMGWDSPSFISIGTFLCDYDTAIVPSAYTNMAALNWNTIQTWAHLNTPAVTANNISVVGSFQNGTVSSPNLVGINTYDEPDTYAHGVSSPISTQSNAVQDPAFWQVNNTINFLIGNLPTGIPAPSTAVHMLSIAVATPNATTRHIDLQSMDEYWFAGSRDPNQIFQPINGKTYYGLGSNMTADQAARASNYGDTIDTLRGFQSGNFPAPLGVYIETGDPYWDQLAHGNTNATTSTSSAVLSFAATPSFVSTGQVAFDQTTSTTLGTVLSSTGTTVTLNANSLGAVGSGDVIQFYFQSTSADVILPPEFNAAVWNTIIHGALMLYLFDHFGPTTGTGTTADNVLDTRNTFFHTVQSGQSLSMNDQVAATCGLVKLLAPIIKSPFALSYASVSPAGYVFPTAHKVLPAAGSAQIDIMTKWYQGGSFSNTIGGGPTNFTNGFYIFANPRGSLTDTNIAATFTVPSGATLATVVGENRTIAISGGTFSDTFVKATDVHIYQVT